MPWLRIVWETWFFKILTDDDGNYYVKWARGSRLRQLRGKRASLYPEKSGR